MPDRAQAAFSITRLNQADDAGAVAAMGDIVERSDWLAARVAAARPFADDAGLIAALEAEVARLTPEEALTLLRAHPELAPPAPSAMTPASQAEQGRLALLDPGPDLADRLADLNRRYRKRHGYPFVIALHAQADMDAVIAQFESRLEAEPARELDRALGEVVSVMKARLARLTAGAAGGAERSAPRGAQAFQPGEAKP